MLKDVLPQPYFSHYALLVASIHILTSDSVAVEDLNSTEVWLTKFYKDYMEYYGKIETLHYRRDNIK